MKLSRESLGNISAWEGIHLPKFDIDAMVQNTEKNPQWLHFGAGNIFRGYVASLNQRLLELGATKTGIVAVESFDFDIIDKIYRDFDNLTLLVRLKSDGSMKKELVAGVSHAWKANQKFPDFQHIVQCFCSPSLQMVSFTITEKGYNLYDSEGKYLSFLAQDLEKGPEFAENTMTLLTALLHERFLAGEYPLALCSMDNCSHNGEKLQLAVLDIAENWRKNGFVADEFLEYLKNDDKITFPWSMIDKITPRPDESVQQSLEKHGLEAMKPIITSKNTFIAPFVNAETAEYLVIEDKFPNGRPELEKVGVFFTSRTIVNQVETMKVTTCLNPLHTALAVFGPLLSYHRIFEEMKQPVLRKLVEKIGYDEGMKVVIDPKIISPQKFIKEVLEERLTNPFIPDDPARIATDTSQKVGIRFGETIKAYMKSDCLNVQDLTYIPLVLAGWFRYLLAIDDKGNPFTLSPDPMLEELQGQLSGLTLGGEYQGELEEILTNEGIFGVNLKEIGLSSKIEGMFQEMLTGVGAVHSTLEKYVIENE